MHALRGIDLALPHGSFTAVMGPSGSGKSTFPQCAAGPDRPTAGSVTLGGTEITGMLPAGTAEVLGLLRHAVDALGATVVRVTHDPVAASYADRVLFLADGSVADRLTRAPAHEIADRMTRLTARTPAGLAVVR